ncbi:amino acid adenylation domain-containing protein [Pantoea sp. Ap-967]|uniref:amino acid adenylation domain-containing protein n=1 Tax=Pantoea sp. Ap-967 TaxID=2608362 RepID=UPI0014223CD2|nr:amino acid adenylation domain-containing protein [Pantoea sp. Ap-967]NIE73363.1 amino acid adenylation domain-containing protein [Pantoea sp. Ap-967]
MPDLRPNPTVALEYNAGRTIFSDFLHHAQQSPDTPALLAPGVSCSYGQLERISHGIAAALLARGAQADDRVVIVASRSAGLVYAMLGALRAGLAFTVADRSYPPARIEQIIQALQPRCLLLCGDAEQAGGLQVPDAPAQALSHFPATAAPLPQVNPEQPAYVTFTSGSTGVPKGVLTHHAPLVHFIDWHVQHHGFTAQDRFSMLSGLGHDPVYRDVFTPLSIGATVCCPAQSTLVNPAQLAAWLDQQGITTVHLTPPLGKLIEAGAALERRVFPRLRYLFWGGDALGHAQYEQVRKLAPNARNVNFYGTTETPQAMAFQPLEGLAPGMRLPLGKGIDGAQLLVVTPSNQLAAPGEEGEILIRSPYLSLGYWQDPGLTAQKFVANPFTGRADDRCYRTGDLGRYLADGSVDFLGRGDSQVKIRGHRIELGEIECALARHGQVRQCVVLLDHANPAPRLVAYCVAAQPVTGTQLREALAQQLPDYMVPAQFVFLDTIPLTPNGKIDKRALPAPAADGVPANQALTPLAQQLAEAWAQILQVPAIDANLSFVELGGDSLTFVQASQVLEELTGQLPARWEMLPVRELAELGVRPKAKLQWRDMEITVFLRMVAIITIVAGHLGLFDKGLLVGETTSLYLVSGIGLARFQLGAIHARGDARSLLKSMASIAVPTLLYTALVQFLFDKVRWQSLLLVSNWFPVQEVGYFSYWYVEVLVQMVLIIGLVLSVKPVCRRLMADPFRCLLLAACALMLADVLLSLYVFDAAPLLNRVPQHYLGVMVLGMAVHFADSPRRKWLASAVALLMIGEREVMAITSFGWAQWSLAVHIDIALPAVLALIWVRAVPLPGLLVKGGALIASSTLYIYLTHFQFQSVARRISDQPLLAVALALVGGIVVGLCWNTFSRAVLLRCGIGRKKPAADALGRIA